MKIGILTSSRADYGIYSPLIDLLRDDKRFNLEIIVFGMNLMPEHGSFINQIRRQKPGVIHEVEGMSKSDSVIDIVQGYAKLIESFGSFWEEHKYECVLTLGDRFEMSAAIQSTIPFEITLAHIHGGEITEGAIDNIYRDQMSIASKIHFTSTRAYSRRLANILGTNNGIHCVGALSLDNLESSVAPAKILQDKFGIPKVPFALVTFHPETVNALRNEEYSSIVYETLKEMSKDIHLVITQTNADTMGSHYRKRFVRLKNEIPQRVTIVDNFGRSNYFAALQECAFLLGNTSSGIIEAASFGKYVINVGNRQKGRHQSQNIVNTDFEKSAILKCVADVQQLGAFEGKNEYYMKDSAQRIKKVLEDEIL